MIDVLRALFDRDLARLRQEIVAYRDEQSLWITEGTVANSAGNLYLHLVGNLQTYVGGVLGQTGYVRDREAEFALKHVPRVELLAQVDSTVVVVHATLDTLSEADLQKEFPQLVFAQPTSTGFLLTHLTTHLAYHLGQINYHRRLLDRP